MATGGFEREAPASSTGLHWVPDASQQAVIDLPDDTSAAVIGAPGTGKTSTLVRLVADRVLTRGWQTAEVLALTPSRATATRLRDAIALGLGVATTGPMARTVNSLAFEIVRDAARAAGSSPPRLITGGEQDADIGQLIDGHIQEGTGPAWPPSLGVDVRRLRRFRTELRELMMRATEYEVSPSRLRDLGRQLDRPEWEAAADFFDEYLAVAAFTRERQLDPAELARYAVAAIASADPGERVDRLRLVVVDDLQEATQSTIAILRALAGRGVQIIAFGDPDVAANAFRGGEPDALGRLAAVLGLPSVRTLFLDTSHRHGPRLRQFVSTVTARIGSAAAGRQRTARAGGTADEPIARIQASTPSRQFAAIARILREEHLERGTAWSDLAVIARSGAELPNLARSLALAEVPVRTISGATALRDDHAARALLTVVDVGTGRTPLTSTLAAQLLLGPFGGLDPLGLRRLRLAIRAEEVAGGGTRTADELLVDGLSAPGRFVTIDHRVARAADRLGRTLARLLDSPGSIEELLWIAWEQSGLHTSWQEQALGGGITAAEANRNLDGIVALFTAAKRFVERAPDASAATFLANVLDADVPEDTLSPRPITDAVLLATPSGILGLEFDTVIIASVQDGAWPNLRLRDSLLASGQLVNTVTGVDSAVLDARKQVLGDELRMFALAVSRSRRRVVLSAVSNDDEAPSAFFGLLPDDTPIIESATVRPLSLRGMAGRLRRELVASDGRDRDAASSLAALAAEGVAGADPRDWHGLIPISSTGPLYEGERVPVSPSSLEKLVESPLDWFLERIAGSDSGVIANVGTIIHAALETAGEPTVDGLWAVVESRWKELLFEAPWLAERQRRIARVFTVALADYLGHFALDGKALVGSEIRFSLDVDNATVSGSIDRVELAPDGAVVIVDLKTGTPITSQTKLDQHPQLGAYQLAYAEGILDEALVTHGEHRGDGAKLLFVKQGVGGRPYREGIQAQLTDEQLDEFRQRVREAAILIAAAEFEGQLELPAFGLGDVSRLRLHRVTAVSSD